MIDKKKCSLGGKTTDLKGKKTSRVVQYGKNERLDVDAIQEDETRRSDQVVIMTESLQDK